MRGSALRRLFPVLLLVLLAAQGLTLWRRHEREPIPQVAAAAIGTAPAFRLRAADGREVTQAELRGRWALVCLAPSGNAEAVRHLAGALKALGGQAASVAALLVATDAPPASPDAAGRAAERFGPGIVGLSGSADALSAAERAFGVRTGVRSLVPGEAPLAGGSGSVIAVLGPDGRLRDVLPGSSNGETVAARLRALGLHG